MRSARRYKKEARSCGLRFAQSLNASEAEATAKSDMFLSPADTSANSSSHLRGELTLNTDGDEILSPPM